MAKLPIGSGLKAGGGILKWLKFGLLSFFLLYLLISIVLSAYQGRDFGIIVKELGEEFYSPLQTAQEYSLKIQQEQQTSFLEGVWKYWGFYFNIYKIFLWLKILTWIFKFIWGDRISPMERYIFATILFYVVQLLFGVLYLKEDSNFIFTASKDVFDGVIHLMTNLELSEGKERIMNFGSNNTCSGEVCVV